MNVQNLYKDEEGSNPDPKPALSITTFSWRCGRVAVGGGGIRAGGGRLQAEQPRLHRIQGLLQHAPQERHRRHSRQRQGTEDPPPRRGNIP
jgi:hypothetical protein